MKIGKFNADIIRSEDTLLLGGAERKNASVGTIIESWPDLYPDAALVIFDHRGRFYERFRGEAMLVDLASEGSLLPDLVEPFVTNEDFGSVSENIAYTMRRAVYQEIRSRDANDKFFDDLGKIVTDRTLLYMLETMKNVVHNIAACSGSEGESGIIKCLSSLNLFTIFCRQHAYIEALAMKTISGETDSLPVKERVREAEKSGLVTREYSLAKYILEHELRYQKNSGRDAPVPFADILLTNGDNTNTQRCIKMQADASTAAFRALVSMMTREASLFRGLETLRLGDFLTNPGRRPLFVCSSGNTSADKGLAPLLIAALGAAGQNTGRGAVIIIPELDRWGVLNYLDMFRQSCEHLRFAFGYENFSRLALESRTEESKLIEALYSASTQRLWHAA
ncbi:MAG: hypothetical protein HUJ86_03825, partial [Synergistes sp.]|nr:hypothetical protein [Synergistes sp.]